MSDPYQQYGELSLKHVLGNVGRPGITLLIPPQDPMVRKVDLEAWKSANYNGFDGTAEDHFTNTSLHLSFTEGSSPVHDGVNRWGRQDSQVFLLESVVSIYDSRT